MKTEELQTELTADMIRTAGDLWRQSGRTITATFGGSSMEPTILAGEPLVVSCGAAFGVGDVVMFFFEDRMVVHRVIAANAQAILTSGDGHWLPDPFVTRRETVIGVIRTVLREGREVVPAAAPRRWASRLFAFVFAISPRAAVLIVEMWRAVSRMVKSRPSDDIDHRHR